MAGGSASGGLTQVGRSASSQLRHEKAEEQRGRLLWTPTITNSGALIAVCAFVGGGTHPDRTFDALAFAFSSFGLGMLIAAAALVIEYHFSSLVLAYSRKMDSLENSLTTSNKVLELQLNFRPDREALVIVKGSPEKADGTIRGLWAFLEKMRELKAKERNVRQTELNEFRENNLHRISLLEKAMWSCVILSHSAFGIGTAYVVLGHTTRLFSF